MLTHLSSQKCRKSKTVRRDFHSNLENLYRMLCQNIGWRVQSPRRFSSFWFDVMLISLATNTQTSEWLDFLTPCLSFSFFSLFFFLKVGGGKWSDPLLSAAGVQRDSMRMVEDGP